MSVIAIDLGGSRLKIGIVHNGEIQALSMMDIASADGIAGNLELLKTQINTLLNEVPAGSVDGIGLAFPGLVDTVQNQVIDTSKKYDDAPAINLAQWFVNEFGLELRMENDARLACLGEWKFGAGMGKSDMVMCTLGTGIGSAVIMNDRILRGKHFQAGVLGGHFIIDYQNTTNKCSCGNYGCVEAMASNWMVEKMSREHPFYPQSKLKTARRIDLATVFKLSEQQDELAVLLRNHCLKTWSAGLINLIHAYDPEIVVVGGGVMKSKNIILPYFKKNIAERAWCPSGFPEVVTATYPDTAALLGASLLFEQFENDKVLY